MNNNGVSKSTHKQALSALLFLYHDVLELVPLDEGRTIWRDINVVISPDADREAQMFLDFLVTEEAQKIMATEGYRR